MTKTERSTKKTINDQRPNFRDERNQLYLILCFACEPVHGTENWAMAVSSGVCSTCGWKDQKAQEQLSEKEGF